MNPDAGLGREHSHLAGAGRTDKVELHLRQFRPDEWENFSRHPLSGVAVGRVGEPSDKQQVASLFKRLSGGVLVDDVGHDPHIGIRSSLEQQIAFDRADHPGSVRTVDQTKFALAGRFCVPAQAAIAMQSSFAHLAEEVQVDRVEDDGGPRSHRADQWKPMPCGVVPTQDRRSQRPPMRAKPGRCIVGAMQQGNVDARCTQSGRVRGSGSALIRDECNTVTRGDQRLHQVADTQGSRVPVGLRYGDIHDEYPGLASPIRRGWRGFTWCGAITMIRRPCARQHDPLPGGTPALGAQAPQCTAQQVQVALEMELQGNEHDGLDDDDEQTKHGNRRATRRETMEAFVVR